MCTESGGTGGGGESVIPEVERRAGTARVPVGGRAVRAGGEGRGLRSPAQERDTKGLWKPQGRGEAGGEDQIWGSEEGSK